MRRVFSFLLVTFLLLSLCACHVDDNATTAPSNTTTTAPDGTTVPISVDISPKTDGWVNIDDSKWSFFANGGYYHDPQMGQQFLAFTDVSNGITVVLCSKPGCKHHEAPAREQDECDAYLGDFTYCIFCFGEKIFYISIDNNRGVMVLYSRNADGTGKEKIAELGTEYTTSGSSLSFSYCLSAGSKLYYRIDVDERVRREDGVYEVRRTKSVVMCCDVTTGEETLIGEFVDEYPHLIAAREDQLLFYTVTSSDKLDPNDPDYFEKVDASAVYLKIWDAGADQTNILFEKTWKEWQGNGFVMDGKYYYSAYAKDEAGNDVYSRFTYDLGTEAVETTDIARMPVGNRYLLKHDSESDEDYFYDLQTQTRLSNEFAAQSLSIEDVGDEGFILSIVYYKEEMTDNGGKIGDRTVYAYVTYDALADGLQASDCLDFYTKHYGE